MQDERDALEARLPNRAEFSQLIKLNTALYVDKKALRSTMFI
jgi:hypothetical protein